MWDGAGTEEEDAAALHGNRLIVCMDEVTELNVREAGPGRSMANCVSQRKAESACSQPLRSGGAGLKPFRMRQNGSLLSEWILPETEKDWKTRPEEECGDWISQRVNCVGKHAAERVHWCFQTLILTGWMSWSKHLLWITGIRKKLFNTVVHSQDCLLITSYWSLLGTCVYCWAFRAHILPD